jgi:hypothetical protein
VAPSIRRSWHSLRRQAAVARSVYFARELKPWSFFFYEATLKPIWTYGIQLWGTASTSNTEILERFQWKALRMIVDAPWYLPITVIRKNLQTPTVTEEIRRYSSQYSARLSAHPNGLIVNLMELPDNRRFRRLLPNDLPTSFLA